RRNPPVATARAAEREALVLLEDLRHRTNETDPLLDRQRRSSPRRNGVHRLTRDDVAELLAALDAEEQVGSRIRWRRCVRRHETLQCALLKRVIDETRQCAAWKRGLLHRRVDGEETSGDDEHEW